MKNYLLTIEYDGSRFHGWQEQPGLRTVQGTLQDVMTSVLLGSSDPQDKIIVAGTSRTDAGVHALGQCCSFSGDFGIPTEKIKTVLNNALSPGRPAVGFMPGDIRVVDCAEVPLDFHARFNCIGKTYRYVLNTCDPNVFRRDYCYFLNRDLDIWAMREAAEAIEGTHDFSCFQAAGGTPRESTVRTIFNLNIQSWLEQVEAIGTDNNIGVVPRLPLVNGMDITNVPEHIWNPGDIIIEITGDGFLYNMVRIIVGTLVEIGMGKRKASSVIDAIESRDRTMSGHTAPANGLYLARIYHQI